MARSRYDPPTRPSANRRKDERHDVLMAFACTFVVTAFVTASVALVLALMQAFVMVFASFVMVQ